MVSWLFLLKEVQEEILRVPLVVEKGDHGIYLNPKSLLYYKNY